MGVRASVQLEFDQSGNLDWHGFVGGVLAKPGV